MAGAEKPAPETCPPESYRVERRPPTVAETRALYGSAGWTDIPDDDAAVARGLAASLFGVVVTFAGEIVACARLVGDGGMYFYLQDVIVLPAHQGKGVGDLVMREIVEYLDACAPANCFVALFAAAGKSGFYERYGFARRAADEPGMALQWEPGMARRLPRPGSAR
jgi:GNAT superfamily N-acetyltransferase